MGKGFTVHLLRSNVSGRIRCGYLKKADAKKNKKLLEHLLEVFIKE